MGKEPGLSEATRSRVLLAVGGAAIFALAGCGSSSSSSSSSSTSASSGGSGGSSGGASGGAAVISAAKSSDLGRTILVDSRGNTLYLFEKDDEPDESYCKGGCASVWPPATTSGKPTARGGVDASKLGTLKRDDGTTQVTYAGHPLYAYEDDKKSGEAKGNGVKEFGAEWYALEPSGAKAEQGDES
jgi:predicted lipoprotein with Yx(FWY)xxD motif